LLIRKGERRKMKSKYLLSMLLAVMLLVSVGPAFAFWHPPDEDLPCPTFVVVIDGVGMLEDDYRFNFTEPDYCFCTDVTVEVWILDVEDMFAYEFKMEWVEAYFTLTDWVVEDVWPSQWVVKPEATYDGSEPYHQAVSALAPSTGVTGDFKLATLTFHIINDACWAMDTNPKGRFKLLGLKASNSCSDPICLCDPYHGWWEFIPVQPTIFLDPPEEINCVVGETFDITVMVEDIVKMKSLHMNIYWLKNELWLEPGTFMDIISTTEDDVVLNDAIFPEVDTFTVSIVDHLDWTEMTIDIVLDCDLPLINGSFAALTITFTKEDPWYCGRQPEYSKENHEWDTDNATTPIAIWYGWFDVYCNDLDYIEFGDYFGWTGDEPEGYRGFAFHANSVFTFDPVPGDLNGDGEVNVADLAIICGYYGLTAPYTGMIWYYDIVDPFHIIDIFDVTVVAKNFGRTCPY